MMHRSRYRHRKVFKACNFLKRRLLLIHTYDPIYLKILKTFYLRMPTMMIPGDRNGTGNGSWVRGGDLYVYF